MRTNEKVLGFNVDAYTARLIGRENVSKLEGAVLEIVKNAYDADAKVFCLYYANSQNCIYILDNGSGMEEQVITDPVSYTHLSDAFPKGPWPFMSGDVEDKYRWQDD